jgi:uncharacterized protein (DUF2141 family)
LEKGMMLARVQTPTPAVDTPVCLALPEPGRYAIAVLHDRDKDGLDVFRDGYGFPGNPKLGLRKPPAEEAAVDVGLGVVRLDVVLNYWAGGEARPLASR